jgi:magnesium-transporting ATPase (P-type)
VVKKLYDYLVPPALPLVLTVGIGIAINRLRLKRIFCIDPERVNFAGSVDMMCWDKTGTLTTSHLSWVGMEPVCDGIFLGFQDGLEPQSGFLSEKQMKNMNQFKKCLVSCHGLNEMQGQVLGHSVDVEMFKKTGWSLRQQEEFLFLDVQGQRLDVVAKLCHTHRGSPLPNQEIFVLKRFEFDAHIQRNSVICFDSNAFQNSSDPFIAFSKGMHSIATYHH